MTLLGAAACALLLQDAATFDLRLDENAPGSAVIDLESQGSVTMTIELPTGPKVEKSKLRISRRLVDETTAVEPKRLMTRQVVKWREDLGDVVEDPPIVGLAFLLTDKGDEVEVTQPDGHRFLPREWDRLTIQMQSTALHVALSKAARIGVPFAAEDSAFLHLLLGLEGTIESSAIEFTLSAIESEKQLATLGGHATARVKLTDPADVTADWTSDFQLVVDLAARRVASVTGDATMVATMDVKGVATGIEAALRFDAKVTVGAPAIAAAAAAEKSKPRERTFRLAAAGVSVALPSLFWIAQREPDAQLQTNPPEGALTVMLRAFPLEGAKFEDAIGSVLDLTIAQNPGTTPPKAMTSSLGKGKGVTLERDGETIDVELYPLGKGRLLRVQIVGNAAVRKRFAKELVRMRATLKALQP